ncbi:DJ-1/PfpI family protein [Kitasatospora sp. NPDC101801]|uniref:DJ-1/PfpI family protein n=1 Tax=Kitasatospora sp. NPDC101801 TaxID=3364103 RepID=UPI0038103DBE
MVAGPSVADCDALVPPGGVADPDALRRDFDTGKPAAATCHGPWTLVEADVVGGRSLLSWPSLRTGLVNTGAQWADEQVRVYTDLVSRGEPGDLRAFDDTLVTVVATA